MKWWIVKKKSVDRFGPFGLRFYNPLIEFRDFVSFPWWKEVVFNMCTYVYHVGSQFSVFAGEVAFLALFFAGQKYGWWELPDWNNDWIFFVSWTKCQKVSLETNKKRHQMVSNSVKCFFNTSFQTKKVVSSGITWFFCYLFPNQKCGAVDGRNPAPVDMVNIPLVAGFHTC